MVPACTLAMLANPSGKVNQCARKWCTKTDFYFFVVVCFAILFSSWNISLCPINQSLHNFHWRNWHFSGKTVVKWGSRWWRSGAGKNFIDNFEWNGWDRCRARIKFWKVRRNRDRGHQSQRFNRRGFIETGQIRSAHLCTILICQFIWLFYSFF